jgi:hypothetical protein
MSIAEFTEALKDEAYNKWFKNSVKSIFIQTTSELRESEQKRQKTSFLITESDIANIGSKLAGRAITQQEIEKIRQDLISSVKQRKSVILRKDNSLFFPIIDFDTGIGNVLKKGFDSIPKVQIEDKQTKKLREARVTDFFQRGHVFSIATNVAEQTRRNLLSSNASQVVKDRFIPILGAIIDQLRKDDLASSNLKSLDVDIYAKYSKNPYKYVVEMQPEEVNRASGIASAPVTNALRRYFDPKNYVQIAKFFRTRANDDSFIQKLISSKGSPSYLNLVRNTLLEALDPKRRPTKSEFSVPRSKISRESIKIDNKKFSSSAKNTIAKITKLKNNLKKAADLAEKSRMLQLQQGTTNLASLMTLINSDLHDQIKRNMGTGNRRDVLNYQTGRFASSAKVERLSESRQGMITAFYSYMKNPYATFSQGGRQQNPRSRDPKLLISKSIRELAGAQVANRMRAVNV